MEKVTVSSKGQIAIPKQVRDTLRIGEGTLLLLDVHNGVITLRRDDSGWRSLRGIAAGHDLLSQHMAEKQEDLARE